MSPADRCRIHGNLIESHDGLPAWFPTFVTYILDRVKGRDRFNLYNASKILRDIWPQEVIYVPEIRDVLGPLEVCGLSFRGIHQQIVLPHETLISFWTSFYLPSQAAPAYDLSLFAHMLHRRRHQDLVKDANFRHCLPAGYKSLKKDRLVTLLLRRLFDSPESYRSYVEARLKDLTPAAKKVYFSLLDAATAISGLPLKPGKDEGLATAELCDALLAKPTYLEQEGRLFLHLARYDGHTTPFKLPGATTQVKPQRALKCLMPILEHVLAELGTEAQVPTPDYPKLRFPWGQLKLLKETCHEAVGILDLLAWWREVLGHTPIRTDQLPGNNTLTKGADGVCRVFAIGDYRPEIIVQLAHKFGLLQKDHAGHFAITDLGDWAGGGADPDMKVHEVWGRNVDRIVLTLSPDWPAEFGTLLQKISVFKDNSYIINRCDVIERNISIEHLLLILGGFVKLDAKREARLRRWFSSAPLPKVLQATAIPIGKTADKEIPLQTGKKVFEVDGFYIVVGVSPSQLLKSLRRR